MRKIVYTVGYGGRSLGEFIDLIKGYGIKLVVDIRRWNKSVRVPEFSGNNLRLALGKLGLRYEWMPALGGYRRFGVDVEDRGIATCFKSSGFRAYATYITTRDEVKSVLEELVALLLGSPSAIMCKERVPWLCHRKILSDYLLARGFRVFHVIDREKVLEHKLSECAVIEGGELKYI